MSARVSTSNNNWKKKPPGQSEDSKGNLFFQDLRIKPSLRKKPDPSIMFRIKKKKIFRTEKPTQKRILKNSSQLGIIVLGKSCFHFATNAIACWHHQNPENKIRFKREFIFSKMRELNPHLEENRNGPFYHVQN
jgi:hypothetical protein